MAAVTSGIGPESTENTEASGTQGSAAWAPRPCLDEAAGCVWLPRLISKGRRQLGSERAGSDLVTDAGYLFGENDPMDATLLTFLRAGREDVLSLLREQPDDAAAAAELVRRSGRTAQECAAWGASLRRRMGVFIAMIEADEGRRAPGWGTSLLQSVYNRLIMPVSYWKYRRDEARAGRA